MKIGFLDMGSWFNVKNNFFINEPTMDSVYSSFYKIFS